MTPCHCAAPNPLLTPKTGRGRAGPREGERCKDAAGQDAQDGLVRSIANEAFWRRHAAETFAGRPSALYVRTVRTPRAPRGPWPCCAQLQRRSISRHAPPVAPRRTTQDGPTPVHASAPGVAPALALAEAAETAEALGPHRPAGPAMRPAPGHG